MRSYFERLEDCRHRQIDRVSRELGVNPSRHGYDGWLPTEKAAPAEALRDRKIRALFDASLRNALRECGASDARGWLESLADPNDWRVVSANEFGTCYTPMTTRNSQRVGTRERLLEVPRSVSGAADDRAQRAGVARASSTRRMPLAPSASST